MLDHEDHRHWAQQLDLLHFQDEAPGMAFWHPAGWTMVRLLEQAARDLTRAQGYEEVRTPQILRRPIWEASGHWRHFAEGMFRVADQAVEAAVKPVNCPGHIQIAKKAALSYRDLPWRVSEFGLVHRDEPGGTLHGLLRLRQFTQDDGHVLCTEEQAVDEVIRFCRSLPPFYAAFGFDRLRVVLSLRPDDRAGDERAWDRAEAALAEALRRMDVAYEVQPGGGAFYGPKIEYVLEDRRGRSWQCGTIQFDLVMPARFDLHYVDAKGVRQTPVMLHRALFGSLERFLGVVLEQHGAALPGWLAPVQVWVLPVGEEQAPAARDLLERLRRAGLRARCEDRESLSRRIVEAHARTVPHTLIIGAREVEGGTVTVRARDGQRTLPVGVAVQELVAACARPPLF